MLIISVATENLFFIPPSKAKGGFQYIPPKTLTGSTNANPRVLYLSFQFHKGITIAVYLRNGEII